MSATPAIDKSAIEVQALSMQWLSFTRTARFVHWDKEQIQTSSLGKIVAAIVKQYNTHLEKLHPQNPPTPFERHRYGFEHPVYKLKVYARNLSMTTALNRSLHRRSQKKGDEIVLFYCKKSPEREVVVLTSSHAWMVVRSCINYQSPTQIAEKILDPNQITQLTRRSMIGHNLKETIHNPASGELYKTQSLYYLVESLQCRMKETAAVLTLPFFATQKSSTPPLVSVTTGGLLRIHARVPLQDFPSLFTLFCEYIHGRPTYNQEGKPEVNDLQFEFLHYVQPAQVAAAILDTQLTQALFTAYEQDTPLLATVGHKYLLSYLNSTSFALQAPNKRYAPLTPARPPYLAELLKLIDQDTPDLTPKTLLEALSQRKLRYTDETGALQADPLIAYLEGEIRYEGRAYYKMRGMWYQITADFNALLIDDFRSILKQKLLRPTEEGQLPNAWSGNKPRDLLQQKQITEVLGTGTGIKKFMKALDTAQMRYVTLQNKVQGTRLVGAILKEEVIAKHKETIEKILADATEKTLHTQLEEAFPDEAAVILEKLQEKRPVLSVETKLGKTIRRVLNPAIYPLRTALASDKKLSALLKEKEEELFTLLETVCEGKSEDEETYNRGYLYDKMNGGAPFGPHEGYLVFDQVLPNNIEPCDIVMYTPRTTRLYHVKEVFGQHTRDVASQILNAAKALRAALSTHQPKDFLHMLWEEGMKTQKEEGWRAMVKKQLEAFGKGNFMKIFTERKIVFVYAFLEREGGSFHEETATPTSLSPGLLQGKGSDPAVFGQLKKSGFLDDKNRLTGKFYDASQADFSLEGFESDSQEIFNDLKPFKPISESTLAKLEVIRLAKELQELNFELEICEIRRPNNASPSSQTPSWVTSQTPDDVWESPPVEVDSEEVEGAPSGLINLGNSCYMNATLQALYFLDDIKDAISDDNAVTEALSVALEERDADSLKKLQEAVFANKEDSILKGSPKGQHDAEEFLGFLLENIDWQPMETYSLLSHAKPDGSGQTGHKTPRSALNRISLGFEEDTDVQTLLNNYFAPELIKGKKTVGPVGHRYQVTSYRKALRIVELPPLLIVHLKRFNNALEKNKHKVDFPEDRVVKIKQKAQDAETSYEIVALINHHGNQIAGGHYTADIKDLTSEEEQWFHCDDREVTAAEPADPERQAYILFLKRIDP